MTELVITIPEQPVIEMEAAKTFRLQNKIVNPSEERQIITADEGYDAIKTATVEAVQTEEQSVDISENGNYNIKPSEGKYIKKAAVNVDVQPPLEDKTAEPKSSDVEYISEQYGFNKFKVKGVPTEHKSATITENGVTIIERSPDKWIDEVDVTVDVQPPLQEKAVTPSDIQQEITADSPYYGMSKTIVQAVPTEIKRIEITENGETHITRSENKWIEDVTVITDVQPKLQTKRVAASTEDDVIVEPDPDKDGMKRVVVEKVNIQNHKEVTPSSITQHINPDTGYVGTWDVEVSPIPSESKSVEITENGNTSVIPSTGKWIERIDINVNVPAPQPVESKDYNFFDWDGTLLYSYDADEINALTKLPPMPAHDGLVGKEWNYTLAQLQSLTQLARPLPANVGYIPQTPDGKSMLLGISIPQDDTVRRVDFEVPANNNTSAAFDWGDGNTETVTAANGVIATSHTYTNQGNYDITVTPSTATTFRMTGGRAILGTSVKQKGYLRKAVLGGFQLVNIVGSGTVFSCFCRQYNLKMFSFGDIQSNDYLTRSTVDGCSSLKAVHFPSWMRYVNPYSVNATGVEVITIPYQVTSIIFAAFCGNARLKFLTLPASLTQISNYPFAGCNLKRLVFPDNTFSRFDNCLYKSIGFEEIILPNLTEIPANFYWGDTQTIQAGIYTPYIYIPPSIMSFGSGAFSGRKSSIGVMDFRDHTSVPTLGSTSGVAALTYVVPDELYDEWIVATNWAYKASAIVKASEYDD